jgi:hypothetical protein
MAGHLLTFTMYVRTPEAEGLLCSGRGMASVRRQLELDRRQMRRRRVVIVRAVASPVLSGKPWLLTVKSYGE